MKRSLLLLRQIITNNLQVELLRGYYISLARLIIKNPRFYILWPISIAFILSYPAIYSIYTSQNLKFPDSTDLKSVGIDHSPFLQFSDDLRKSSDLEVKQLWIQKNVVTNREDFDYEDSNALEKEYLSQVFELEQMLTEGIHLYHKGEKVNNISITQPVGFIHSPLQYWDNSIEKLQSDKILKTIYSNSWKKSFTGLTLSHSSLFSGTVKVNGLVKSADSLLISMFYIPSGENDAGSIWDRNMAKVQERITNNELDFLLFAKDGPETRFQKFYLKFSSFKWTDDFFLVLSYFCIAVYFALSLLNINSVKSRIGILSAFLVEMSLSVLASISVSSYIFNGFDFFYIPLQVLPFVIIVVGMENMLGMINAFSALPEEQSVSRKLSTSLSTRGLSSTLIVLADLCMLLLTMPFVDSSARQFCVFAGIALIIDHFLHLTYFSAVMSVDVRRLELEDLMRGKSKDGLITGDNNGLNSHGINSRIAPWHKIATKLLGDSMILPSSGSYGKLSLKERLGLKLLKVKLPMTTTVFGSGFLIIFLVLTNLRWIDNGSKLNIFGKRMVDSDPALLGLSTVSKTVDLECQGYNVSLIHADKFSFFLDKKNFAVEVADILKDYSNFADSKLSLLVQEPTIFIYKSAFEDSDIMNSKRLKSGKSPKFEISFNINTIYKFDMHYLLEFLTSLIFVCSIAGLVLKVLVKDDDYQSMAVDQEIDQTHTSSDQKSPFHCKDLVNGHFLDVLKITTSSNPFIITVGMDHKIFVWSPITEPIPLPTELPLSRQLWPVTSVIMSDPGNLIAVFSKNGSVKCWSRLTMSWSWSIHLDDLRHTPYLTAYFRKKTTSVIASRKRATRSRFSTVREGEETGLVTRKSKHSPKNSRSSSIGAPLSKTLSIDSTFDRSTDLKLLQLNQDYDLIVVLKDGTMITISLEDGLMTEERISSVPLITADKLVSPRVNDRLVCNTEDGRLVVATVINNKWKVRNLPVQEKYNSGKSLVTPRLLSRASSFTNGALEQAQKVRDHLIASRYHHPRNSSLLNQSFSAIDLEDEEQKQKEIALFANTEIAVVSFVGMIVRTRGLVAELIDAQTGTLVKRFNVGQFKPGTFKVFHSTPVHCRFCGSASVSSFSICYNEMDSNTLILQTFSIDNRAKNNICLRVERDPRETRCLGFDSVTEHQHWLEGVEGWCVSDLNMINGIRKKETSSEMKSLDSSSSYSSGLHNRNSSSSRNRKSKERNEQYRIENIWEGFSLTAAGKVTYHEIPNSSSEGLLIKALGPVAKFGHKSIVVSFGNVLKVLYTGNNNLFDAEVDTDSGINTLGFINRRKRMNVVNYQMTHSTDYGST